MDRRVLIAVAVAGAVGLQGCVVARQPISPVGRAVRIIPVPSDTAEKLAGELMAVSADTLWVGVAQDSEIVSIPLAQVRRVEVRRHKLGAGKAMTYSVILGLATGGALSAACASVEGADCGGVLPGVFVSWMFWGGLSVISLESSAKIGVSAGDWERLRPYARFPQGLPDSLPRRGVAFTAGSLP